MALAGGFTPICWCVPVCQSSSSVTLLKCTGAEDCRASLCWSASCRDRLEAGNLRSIRRLEATQPGFGMFWLFSGGLLPSLVGLLRYPGRSTQNHMDASSCGEEMGVECSEFAKRSEREANPTRNETRGLMHVYLIRTRVTPVLILID